MSGDFDFIGGHDLREIRPNDVDIGVFSLHDAVPSKRMLWCS